MTQYVVVVHRAEEGGYWVEVPALDGCFAQGESLEAALEDARGAIVSHLQALEEFGVVAEDDNDGPALLITTVAVA